MHEIKCEDCKELIAFSAVFIPGAFWCPTCQAEFEKTQEAGE